jgi:hypothetical protein
MRMACNLRRRPQELREAKHGKWLENIACDCGDAHLPVQNKGQS